MPVAKETEHMKEVAKYLDLIGVLWFHPVNEGKRSYFLGRLLKEQGLKAGWPDILIFERWVDLSLNPLARNAIGFGIAIELKSLRQGAKASKEQERILMELGRRNWKSTVAKGDREAIAFVQKWLAR